jgi:predicted phage terminase large subunit-like protein
MIGGDAWRLTPVTFARHVTNGDFIAAKHLIKASSEIATAIYQGGARLLIAWPPRHGKSEMLSVYTPEWFLDLFPHKKVAMASYGSDLIEDFSVRVRDNINEHGQAGMLNVRIKDDRQRVNNFSTTRGGALRAVGIGGPLTGRGADLLLIDDYLKNAKDAMSKGIRDDIYDWFRSVAFTRLEPGASVCIFAARWDVDDLAGRLERDAPGVWKIIRFPAICDSTDDVLGRNIGDALWPERYNVDQLHIIEQALGKFFWNALYQQRPLKKVEGLQRDSFEIVNILPAPSRLRIVRAWDFAATEDGGDWTVGTLMAEDLYLGLIYVLDVTRFQKSPAGTEDMVKAIAERDAIKYRPLEILIEEEPGSSGKITTHLYKTKVLRGYNVVGIPAVNTGSKILRGQPFAAAAEAKIVKLLEGAWNKEFIDEWESYPEGEPDDQRDSSSIAYNRLLKLSGRSPIWGRQESIVGGKGLVDPNGNPVSSAINDNGDTHNSGAVWGVR